MNKFFNKIKSGFKNLYKKYFTGMTKRWMTNFFSIVFFVVVLIAVVMGYVVKTNYYAEIENRLFASADSSAKYFKKAVYPQYNSFDLSAKVIVEDFEEKSMMEIQVSDISGKNTYSSTGFAMGDITTTPDIISARNGNLGVWTGKASSSNEKIMSISVPLYDKQNIIRGTIRVISSVEKVDRQLMVYFIIIGLLSLGVIMLTLISGAYFINSIVLPMKEVSIVADKISKGDMTARLEKYKKDDEIGDLYENINLMASELSETEKMKNDFISSISHELRTPLTAIRGWSETMLASENENVDKTTQRGIEVIYKETARLSKLVDELLDMSRIQNNSLKLVVDDIDVVSEFEETVFMMMDRAKSEKVIIDYHSDVEIAMILGDKNKLKQVFFNLIDNAIKHSNEMGKINTYVTQDEENINLIIEDFGEGISKEDLPNIKKMFYKGKSQKRGSGIGLGISDEIVNLHGGSLNIESELGFGTKVTVALPLKKETQSEE